MLAVKLLVICGLIVDEYHASSLTDPVYHKFPQLFHLDNYDRCMSDPDGLYCIGRFQLTADSYSPLYNDMQIYSAEPLHFNRTALHRGYCVSSRCPSNERNTTWRFEQCVQERVNTYGLRATLLSYRCDVRTEPTPPVARDYTFLWAVGCLLLLNFMGTFYDLITDGSGEMEILMAWSLRVNWRRLRATHDKGDPQLTALAPVQGIRVLLLVIIIFAHASAIPYKMYLYNPQALEKGKEDTLMIFRNGHSLVQWFVVISNALNAYTLIQLSKKVTLGFSKLPLFILHRIFRLTPIHLLVVGFAATWWKYMGNGPQWPELVNPDADICRRKFWLHALFLNNMVNEKQQCVVPTWFVAVDFQLYVIASVVMIVLLQRKWRAIPVLSAMFVVTCVLNTALAYYNEWKGTLYVSFPEVIRTGYRDIPSFTSYYIAPWGSLPAALLGLLVVHVHLHMQQKGYKLEQNKVFVFIYHLAVPLQVAWIFSGMLLYKYNSLWVTTLHVGLERPLTSLIAAMWLLGVMNNIDNVITRVMSLRGWQILSRLSLSVLLIHWCINKAIVGPRQTLLEISPINIAADTISTWWWTYCLALPTTLMVEMPFTKMFNIFVS